MNRLLFSLCLSSISIVTTYAPKSTFAQSTSDYTGYYTTTKLGMPFILELTQTNSSVKGTLQLDDSSLNMGTTSKLVINCSIEQGIASGTMKESMMNTTSPIRLEIIDSQTIYMHETRQTLFQKNKEVVWTFSRNTPPQQNQQNNSSSTNKGNNTEKSTVQGTSSSQACTEVITNKRIQESLDAMTMSFIKKDSDRLQEYVLESQSNIACLKETITKDTAFQMHQLFGMYHWINKANTDAKKSFSVAKGINSNKGIDTYIYPEGHFIHSLYEQSTAPENQSVKYPNNDQVYYFDGKKTFYRPKDTPTIFQIEQNGSIVLSQYILPREELPTKSVSANQSSKNTQLSANQSSQDSEVQKWTSRLQDRKLTYMSSYSSSSYDGSYVGGSDRTVYVLCATGKFQYSGSSSFSVDVGSSGYGNNSQNDRGNWSVQNNNGEMLLVFDYLDGSQSTFTLSREDSKTFLDDTRYYKTSFEQDSYPSICQ